MKRLSSQVILHLIKAVKFLTAVDSQQKVDSLNIAFNKIIHSMALPDFGAVDCWSAPVKDESSSYGDPYLQVCFAFMLGLDSKLDSPQMTEGALKDLKNFIEPKFRHTFYKNWPIKTKIRPDFNRNAAVLIMYMDPNKTEDVLFKKHLDGIVQYMLQLAQKYDLEE